MFSFFFQNSILIFLSIESVWTSIQIINSNMTPWNLQGSLPYLFFFKLYEIFGYAVSEMALFVWWPFGCHGIYFHVWLVYFGCYSLTSAKPYCNAKCITVWILIKMLVLLICFHATKAYCRSNTFCTYHWGILIFAV